MNFMVLLVPFLLPGVELPVHDRYAATPPLVPTFHSPTENKKFLQIF